MTLKTAVPKPPKSPRKTRKPLKRSLVARSLKPIPKVNKKRKERLFREDFHSVEYVRWIQGWPCALCRVGGYSIAEHTKTRGAGGKYSDLIPLCESRQLGTRWAVEGCHEKRHRGDEELLAAQMWLRSIAAHYWIAFEQGVKPDIDREASA